jgi:DNA repair protein RecN (Recombination protein N)
MLLELLVEDYAIIERTPLKLDAGLNVLTGETGAGKSILVGALSFALGERVSDEVIRKGSERCKVEALFHIDGPDRARLAEEFDFVDPKASSLRITREINRGGRSKCWVDGRPVPVTAIREIGNRIVDFHGQHEHQMLLHARCHGDLLDGFGDLLGLREELGGKRKAMMDLGKRIAEIEREIAYIKSRHDLVRYEIDEIEKLNLVAGEDAEIEREVAVLEHAEKILDMGAEALERLYDGDDAAIRQVSRSLALLRRLGSYSDEISGHAESLAQAEAITKEVGESLRDYLSRIDMDPSRLEDLRERQVAVERAKRKYGGTVEAVLDHLRRMKAGLDGQGGLELEVRDLKAARSEAESQVADLADRLSAERKSAAVTLENQAAGELESLGIRGGAFKVMFEDLEEGEEITDKSGATVRVGDSGKESIEFFVRTNPGEDLLPLRRIASGGEISRVMLGLKRILADIDHVGTLIFDEIDSGIGGSMADIVARKLTEVARSHQVICITHLPQIAGSADLHLAVGKNTARGRTITDVARVEGDERVTELARMIGGKKAPRSAVLHAEEILKRAVRR